MRRKAKFFGKAVLMLAAAALAGLVVMLLWNEVATVAFDGARRVDYLHALGLLLLFRILLGGFRGGGGWRRGRGSEKWRSLTPTERGALRDSIANARTEGTSE